MKQFSRSVLAITAVATICTFLGIGQLDVLGSVTVDSTFSEPRLRLAVGDVFLQEHRSTITSEVGNDTQVVNAQSETTLTVVAEPEPGVFVLHAQTLLQTDSLVDKLCSVYSFRINKRGQVLSFPGRFALMQTESVQGFDVAQGGITPIVLPQQNEQKWKVQFDIGGRLLEAEAHVEDEIDQAISKLTMSGQTSSANQAANLVIKMSFDKNAGLPLSWDYKLTVVNTRNGAEVVMEGRTEMSMKNTVGDDTLRELRIISESLVEMQSSIGSGKKADALEQVEGLRQRFPQSRSLLGIDLWKVVAARIPEPCVLADTEEGDR